MRNTLVLFTGSYPFSAAAENTFLPQEIAILKEHFASVVVVPTSTRGTRAPFEAANVTVDTSYAAFIGSWPRRLAYAALAVVDPAWWGEVLANAGMFVQHPVALKRALHHHIVARMTERWVRRRCHAEPYVTNAILYTWWFDGTTLGLARFGRSVGAPVVTRAHGYDLYESRHSPPYIPFRRAALAAISRVFSASRAGAEHLAARYPESSAKVETALLGTDDPGFRTPASSDDVFRIVSCSFLVGVKRIDLLIDGLAAAGAMYPARRFHWTHVGDGPERAKIEALAKSELPANVTWHRMDYAGPQALMDFYRTEPVDVFVNTSASEGTPVSIMEAISCGMPVIATSVGGNVEIVGPTNGLLLPANPEPREIAEAFHMLIESPELRAELRAGSRAKWETDYSARMNYEKFVDRLVRLSEAGPRVSPSRTLP